MIAKLYLMATLLVFAATVSARHHRPEPSTEVEDPAPAATEERDAGEVRRHRRKRWYTAYGYQQPSFRDEAPPAGPYDPFAYIYRRLDELAAIIRQPLPPPPQAPIFVPYPVYLPPCGCPNGAVPAQPTTANDTIMPTFPNRVGGDDTNNDDYDDVPLRPLTFDPVKPDRPLSRPVPPVEHGSTQAGASPSGQQGREPSGFGLPAQGSAAAPGQASASPSRCDVAVLTCCHQRYTTNQCFQTLGCPSALRERDPCDPRTLNNVVTIFQKYYRNQN